MPKYKVLADSYSEAIGDGKSKKHRKGAIVEMSAEKAERYNKRRKMFVAVTEKSSGESKSQAQSQSQVQPASSDKYQSSESKSQSTTQK